MLMIMSLEKDRTLMSDEQYFISSELKIFLADNIVFNHLRYTF
jgi:hypothetical protein